MAPEVGLTRGAPGRLLNIYLLGDVVVDSGWRWSRSRLRQALAGRKIKSHVLTHAHCDHAGSSAWLCQTFDVPLWCGAGDSVSMSTGQVDTHGSTWLNRIQRAALPVEAHPVERALHEGDLVGGFEVIEVPGHTNGSLAFWRQQDRVLICGDALANFGLTPERPRLVLPPAKLSTNREQNRDSVRRLIELRPRLACFGHGFAIRDPGRFAAEAGRLIT
jgi:glyoxylase-like metal-dependent hydrolase (beta-lactamase superfamily II)